VASGTSRLSETLLASARFHLPMRILGSLHASLNLADQVVVVELTRATEQTFLGLRFVHSLNDTVQVDPLVEALAEAHDRIEEPEASPRPATKSTRIAPMDNQKATRSTAPSNSNFSWQIAKSRSVTFREATVRGFLRDMAVGDHFCVGCDSFLRQ
jgi:hypothetical protein